MAQHEGFGTRMSETLLLSLGTSATRIRNNPPREGLPLPPPSRWISNTCVGRLPGRNAIASMRTLPRGTGARRTGTPRSDSFKGLVSCARQHSAGRLLQFVGGDRATQNAINALFDIGYRPTYCASGCQAEYGTGVRAGSLDQQPSRRARPHKEP
jgi:hypothetical protein